MLGVPFLTGTIQAGLYYWCISIIIMMIIIIIIIFIYIVWTRLSFAPGLFSASSHTMGGGHGGGEEEWSTNRLSVLIFWKCSEQFPHPRICLMPTCRDQKNLCSSFVQEAQCSSRDHCVQTSRLVSAFQAGIGISCMNCHSPSLKYLDTMAKFCSQLHVLGSFYFREWDVTSQVWNV